MMLSTMNRRMLFKKKNKNRVAKFFPRWDGPYLVTQTHLEASTYTIDMPNQPDVFHMFHSGELKLHIENDPVLFLSREFTQLGPIVSSEGLEEFEIDEIIDAKPHGCGWRYLVHWVGYGPNHDWWMSGAELKDCKALDHWFAGGGDGAEHVSPAPNLSAALVLYKNFEKTGGADFSEAGWCKPTAYAY